MQLLTVFFSVCIFTSIQWCDGMNQIIDFYRLSLWILIHFDRIYHWLFFFFFVSIQKSAWLTRIRISSTTKRDNVPKCGQIEWEKKKPINMSSNRIHIDDDRQTHEHLSSAIYSIKIQTTNIDHIACPKRNVQNMENLLFISKSKKKTESRKKVRNIMLLLYCRLLTYLLFDIKTIENANKYYVCTGHMEQHNKTRIIKISIL